MTNVTITNNGEAPYGAEKVGGGYVWIKPGATKTLDAANIPAMKLRDDLTLDIDAKLDAPPASLTAKAQEVGAARKFDHDRDGKPGGSRRGRASTAAKGARRRRKAASK